MVNYRLKLAPTLARTSPVFFLVTLILNMVINPGYNSLYYLIAYNFVIFSNWCAKTLVAKPVYKLFNTNNLPILGRGTRPIGASSCQFIYDESISTTFGMPSGHSQIAWAVAAFILAKITKQFFIKKDQKVLKPRDYLWLVISYIIILSGAAYISYFRVYIDKCHTIQQVIVGGLIGIGLGYMIYYFENDVVNFMEKLFK